MPYQLRNEDNELMRIVARQEEAQALLSLRPEWSSKFVKQVKPELPKFEDAPF